jgi:putative ABC transport system permease protein
MPFNLGRQHDERTASNAMITLETDAVRSNDIVKRVVNARLVARRGGIDDFTFYDLSGVVQKFHTAFAVMQALVGAIAAIALLIGGVGVMNMMLVSVSERVREIGVRKALGATAAAIRTQFIVESALLSGLGGAVGVGLGVVLALGSGFALRALLPTWVVSVSLLAAGIAFAAALSVGVLFGWLPARRAARLAPVEAMRR